MVHEVLIAAITSPQADEMNTEKAFAVGKEVVSDDGTGKVNMRKRRGKIPK